MLVLGDISVAYNRVSTILGEFRKDWDLILCLTHCGLDEWG